MTSTHRAAAHASSPVLADLVAGLADELVALRRDLHAHPEIGRAEVRTTEVVADRLRLAGLDPVLLPGTGLTCDIGADRRPAEPYADAPSTPWRCAPTSTPCRCRTRPAPSGRSTVPGAAHACGHDVHTAVVLGAGSGAGPDARARAAALPGAAGVPAGRGVDARRRARRPGGGCASPASTGSWPCTATPTSTPARSACASGRSPPAADSVRVVLRGAGGHTSRPHLTGDLVFALGHVATTLPAALCAPDGPARRRQPGLGPRRRRGGAERHPAGRRARGHAAGAGRRRLGARRRAAGRGARAAGQPRSVSRRSCTTRAASRPP